MDNYHKYNRYRYKIVNNKYFLEKNECLPEV